MNNKKKTFIYIIIGLLISFVVATAFFYLKRTFEYDEAFSIALSNWFKGEYTGWFTYDAHGWYEREFFNDPYVIDESEAFKYSLVNNNQYWDCHPPFFYWVVHTLSSILKGRFSVWFGYIINIPFYLLNCLLIFAIIKGSTNSNQISLASMLLYSTNSEILSSFIFIRMYHMVTTFVLLYLYIAIKIMHSNKVLSLHFALLFITIILGGLTHYYFYIATLCISLFVAIHMLFKKQFKRLLAAILTYIVAALVNIFLIFPGTIHHLSSSHSETAIDKITNISIDLSRYIGFIKGAPGGVIMFTLGIVILLLLFISKKKSNTSILTIIILLAYYLYFAFVGYTATYVVNRYMLPIDVCFFIGIVLGLYTLTKDKKIALAAIIIFVFMNFDYKFLLNIKTDASWDYAKEHQDDIAIVINKEGTTDNDIQSSLFADLRWYIATLITDLNDSYTYAEPRNAVLYVNKGVDINEAINKLNMKDKYTIDKANTFARTYDVYHATLK